MICSFSNVNIGVRCTWQASTITAKLNSNQGKALDEPTRAVTTETTRSSQKLGHVPGYHLATLQGGFIFTKK